jgi:hypothetical protein
LRDLRNLRNRQGRQMPFQFFTVSPHGAEQAERAINAFLCGHRILAVDRRWVEQGSASFWSFCIDYLAGAPAPGFAAGVRPGGPRGRVDYREVLKPEEFAVFARPRERRKEIATAAAVPVYSLFTNEQLARMVQTRAASRAGLEKIEGVGDGRLDEYGDRMLEILAAPRGSLREGLRGTARRPGPIGPPCGRKPSKRQPAHPPSPPRRHGSARNGPLLDSDPQGMIPRCDGVAVGRGGEVWGGST